MSDAGTLAGLGERQTTSLDGPWRFRLDGHGDWRDANVPNPWQAEFADLRHASGRAVYARKFTVPAEWAEREVALHFGAVNYFAEVLVNGTVLGTHEGGYLPFEFVLPVGLSGSNDLEVRVTLPTGDRGDYPDYPFGEIPHGKQSWYGPLGGIWQSVTLVARDARHVAHCAITANPASGEVTLRFELPPAAIRAEIGITVLGPDGRAVAASEATVGGATASVTLTVDNPQLWSPDAPNLYVAQIDVTADDKVVDRTRHTFGFRSIEARDGKLFLNGQPLYMRAALDQDYYPQGICTPPSLEFLEDQARKAKELGLNLLRCHIKVPDPRYYEVADRLGLLVWTEIPNIASFTTKSAQRLRDTMDGIIRRDGNHPSIVTWTLINEDWGTRLIENADHRQWLKDSYDWLKAKDPTRLVVDNSACIPNFHVKTDINDYHYYRSVPERRQEWERLTEEFAAGASWAWSPHGDAEQRGDEPLVVSEFGVWGLPNPKNVLLPDGSEPWWMETGSGWGDGAAYPHGIANRFDTYHLDTVFDGFDTFIEAVQWFQYANLKYEIESMRAHAPIVGYVITEFTDVHWEANGLLDIERNPRVFHNRFAEFNTDLVIVPQLERHAVWAGDSYAINLKVATGGKSLPTGAVLKWTSASGASGSIGVPATEPLAVTDLGTVTVEVPVGASPGRLPVNFTLEASGEELARNEVFVTIYGPRSTSGMSTIASADPQLAARARALGYTVTDAVSADVIVVHALDASDIEAMRLGARYLVLADGTVPTNRNLRTDAAPAEPPTPPFEGQEPGLHLGAESQLPNIAVHARHGTLWRGDWIANFSWIRRSGAFAALHGGPLLDVSFDGVVPRHVMTGFRSWEYEGLIHAGVVIGWIQKPAATIAERRVGRGGLLATTFRLLTDAPLVDPVATTLFDALVTTAAGLPKDAGATA